MLSRQILKRKKGFGAYYENHHILPECLGGSDIKDNMVLLTAREHFLAHKILCRIYPSNKDLAYSFWGMCNQRSNKQKRYIADSRSYEEAKLLFVKFNTGDYNPKGFLGKSHTDKTKQIQSSANKNKVYSKETRDKIKLSRLGTKYSLEVNLKKGKKDQDHPRARSLKHLESGVIFQTLKHAAKHFNVSRTTIYKWIDKQIIVSI